MKKLIYSAVAMACAFFAASCQKEMLAPVASGNTVTYTVQVADAVATKALGDDVAAVNELVYEVYRTEAEETTTFTDADNLLYHKTATITNGTATIELEFVNDQNFTVLFWAHTKDNGVYNVENLTNVTITSSDVANNVNAQAFVGRDFVRDCVSDALGKVTLRRPVSQLNIATTPESLVKFNDAIALEGSSVKVSGLATSYNIATLCATGNPATDFEYTETAVPTEKLTVNGKEYTYVAMNYVGFAPEMGTSDVTVSYVINTSEGNIDNKIVNVPVKPNYRTNIVGNLITSKTEYTITLEKNWDTPSEDVYAIWDGKAIAEPALDEAAAEPTYIISDAAELAWLAAAVNGTLPTTRSAAAQTFKGYNFVLTHDIDLNNEHWTPIGTKEGGCFEGAFDGNGHKIMNLKYQSTEDDWYVGLFGTVKDATIKNLTIENANIYCEKGLHFAALVGDAAGTTVIENVTVQGDVKVAGDITNGDVGRIGAVIGGNYGKFTLKNVTVNANEGSYVKGNSSIGGVAGQLQGTATFENVTSNIDVVGYKFFAGGIIGLAPTGATFTSCSTSGNVSIIAGRAGNANDLYRVGGIVGSWEDGAEKVITLIDCSYTGELSGKTADGTAAVAFDCAGFVGRGYSAVAGAKVVVNGAEYVYAGNGSYELGGALLVANAAGFTAALEAKAERIVLLPGVYEGTYAIKADGTTIEGQEGAVVACINLNGADNVTLKNIEFDAAMAKLSYDYTGAAKQYANIHTGDLVNKSLKGAHNLVIDGCAFTGTFAKGGASIAFVDYKRTSGFSGNITIKNCTFDTENAYYNIYSFYTGDSTNGHGNFVIENNTFNTTFTAGGAIYLGRYASNVPVEVTGNTFNVAKSLDEAMYLQDHSSYGVSINASNNTFAN